LKSACALLTAVGSMPLTYDCQDFRDGLFALNALLEDVISFGSCAKASCALWIACRCRDSLLGSTCYDVLWKAYKHTGMVAVQSLSPIRLQPKRKLVGEPSYKDQCLTALSMFDFAKVIDKMMT
jgi:hypothetical protein